MDLSLDRRTGNATLDLDAARAVVKKAMPAMRACLAQLPTVVFEVAVTRIMFAEILRLIAELRPPPDPARA